MGFLCSSTFSTSLNWTRSEKHLSPAWTWLHCCEQAGSLLDFMVKPQLQELFFFTTYYESFQAHTKVKVIDNKHPRAHNLSSIILHILLLGRMGFSEICYHYDLSPFSLHLLPSGFYPILVAFGQPLHVFWSLRVLFVSNFYWKWSLWVWMISRRKGEKCWLMQPCSYWKSQ